MITKFHKRRVKGKEHLDKVYIDALSLYNEDTRDSTNIQIFEVDKEKWKIFLDAPENTYLYIEEVNDNFVQRTEDEYENYKYEHIDEYI